MKRLNFRRHNFPLFALLFITSFLTSSLYLTGASAQGPTIRIRIANAAAIESGDAVGSFYIDGINRANLPYGFSTAQITYERAGLFDSNVSFYEFGAEEPIATITYRFEDDQDYTLIAIGDGDNQPISLVVVEDDFTPPSSGKAKVRFGHLAPFSDQAGSLVDIRWEDTSDATLPNPIVNNIVYGSFEGRYREVTPTLINPIITSPDGEIPFIDPLNIRFEAGDIVSAYLIGDDNNQPLSMIVFTNDNFGLILPAVEVVLEKSFIQVGNFSPYTLGSGPVDVALNGVPYVEDFGYGLMTDLRDSFAVKPAGNYNVSIVESGTNLSLVGRNVTFEKDKSYRVLTAGNDVEQPLQVLSFEEPTTPPQNGRGRIQFYNLMPLDSELSRTQIDLVDDNGNLLASDVNNVEFGQVASFGVDPGRLEFQVVSDDGGTLYFDPIDIDVSRGDDLAIFAVGDGVRQPFRVYLVINGDSGRFLNAETDTPATDGGYLALAHLAPQIGEVDIRLDDTVVLSDAPYGTSVAYRRFDTGSYQLEVYASDTGALLSSESVTIGEESYQTAFVSGNGSVLPVDLLIVEDDQSQSANSVGTIRFGHLAPYIAPDTIINIELESGASVARNIRYGDLSDYQFRFAAGQLDLRIVSRTGDVVLNPRPITLASGDLVTLILTGDNQTEPLALYAQYNQDPGFFLSLTQSSLYVAHLASFAGSANGTEVDVRLDGELYIEGLRYGGSVPYAPIDPGTYNLEVVQPGTSAPIISEEITIEPDVTHSLYIGGNGVTQGVDLYFMNDDLSGPPAGSGKIRLGHLAPFAQGRLDTVVDIRYQDGEVLFDDIEFGQFDRDYSTVLNAGTYDLVVTDSSGGTVLFDPVPISVSNGDVTTLIISGGDDNQSFGLYEIKNGTNGRFLSLEGANAEVYIAHLAPFAENIDDTRVTVTVDGVSVLINFAYGDSTGQYIDVAPGRRTIEIVPNDPTYPTLSKEVDFSGGRDYTLFAIGDGNRQSIDLFVTEDDNRTPINDQAKVKLGHLAPFASGAAATAGIRNQIGQVILSEVQYGSDSDGYISYPEGVLNLQVTSVQGEAILVDPGPVNLNRNDIASMWVVGDGVNQPLGMYMIRNSGLGEFLPLENGITNPDLPQLSVTHLSPLIAGDAMVELRVDGQTISGEFKYGDSTGYVGTPEGAHLVEVVASGTDAVIMSRTINVRSGKFYSVFAVGDGQQQNLELVAYEFPIITSPDPEKAHIVAINLAPFSERVSAIVADVNLQTGDQLFNGLAYKIPQDRLLDRGNYDLLITSDDGSVVLADPLPITLERGDSVHLILTGDGSKGNQPMQLFGILNGTQGFFIDNFGVTNAAITIYLPFTAID